MAPAALWQSLLEVWTDFKKLCVARTKSWGSMHVLQTRADGQPSAARNLCITGPRPGRETCKHTWNDRPVAQIGFDVGHGVLAPHCGRPAIPDAPVLLQHGLCRPLSRPQHICRRTCVQRRALGCQAGRRGIPNDRMHTVASAGRECDHDCQSASPAQACRGCSSFCHTACSGDVTHQEWSRLRTSPRCCPLLQPLLATPP